MPDPKMQKPQLPGEGLLCPERAETDVMALEQKWQGRHRRYFQIAGITICLEADLDLAALDFKEELEAFAVLGPGDDNIYYYHHFEMPDLTSIDLGTEVYRKPPWAISRCNGNWYYLGIVPGKKTLHRMAVFNSDHSSGTIFSAPHSLNTIQRKGWQSLSLFPTDQVLIGPLLADRRAVLLHCAAAIIEGEGFIFVGHSDAGKSTTMELLKSARDSSGLNVEILCDDRNVIRRWPQGWRVHGTWSHGTTADVSASSAPLKGVLFLEQSEKNEITILNNRKLVWKWLLATLIRAAVTAEWWQQELDVLQQMVDDVQFYVMRFDKSGAIVPEICRIS